MHSKKGVQNSLHLIQFLTPKVEAASIVYLSPGNQLQNNFPYYLTNERFSKSDLIAFSIKDQYILPSNTATILLGALSWCLLVYLCPSFLSSAARLFAGIGKAPTVKLELKNFMKVVEKIQSCVKLDKNFELFT